jgi:hypothetical protein
VNGIGEYGIGNSTVHPAAVGPAVTSGYNAYVIARSGVLCDVVGAGDLTAADLENLPADELGVRRANDDQVARAQLGEGETLAERTMDQSGEHASQARSSLNAVTTLRTISSSNGAEIIDAVRRRSSTNILESNGTRLSSSIISGNLQAYRHLDGRAILL